MLQKQIVKIPCWKLVFGTIINGTIDDIGTVNDNHHDKVYTEQ